MRCSLEWMMTRREIKHAFHAFRPRGLREDLRFSCSTRPVLSQLGLSDNKYLRTFPDFLPRTGRHDKKLNGKKAINGKMEQNTAPQRGSNPTLLTVDAGRR